MAVEFKTVPTMFGAFHIGWRTGITEASLLFYFIFRNLSEKALLRVIFGIGVFMVLGEIWKQYFSYIYVCGRQISLWYFPWQLCSISMYLGVLLPLIKGRARETCLIFLGTYSLLAALMALAVPADMLRIQILLASHGFLYHGLMILQSIAAILMMKRHQKDAPKQFRDIFRAFTPSLLLFFVAAAIAEMVNIISHIALHDPDREPNMFSITPYYESTQPVFHEIALAIGIIPEIILYLLLISLASFGLFILQQASAVLRPQPL